MKITDQIKKEAWRVYSIFENFPGFGEPAYKFEVGDRVACGNLQDCVVEEILDPKDDKVDMLVYGISHLPKRIKEANEDAREFNYVSWYKLRPHSEKDGTSNFTLEDDIRINFIQTTIDSLLSRFYLHGVNMEPDYQRNYVWEDADKESLLDSIFAHIEIGKFAFVKKEYPSKVAYEILDGKQRLSTLLDFYENRLQYRGYHFNDLSYADKSTFLHTLVTVGDTSELSEEQVYTYFYKLNKAGKVMDQSHLEEIKAKLNK